MTSAEFENFSRLVKGARIDHILCDTGVTPAGERYVRVQGIVLDNGTEVLADGGEDAGGGYGFLCLERDR